MNLNNALLRLGKGPVWLLRRTGFDIIRYRGSRNELDNKLASITHNTITAGPFKGVRLPDYKPSSAAIWSWTRDRGNKLLGF
jgi:hypothetical protein